LRFKTDTSEIGPVKGAPAIIGAGMAAGRASVILSAPEEISAWIKLKPGATLTEEEVARVERERLINPLITINTPIDGTVIGRKVGPGQYVRSDSGDALYSISNLSTMWLRANVPENDIPLVRVGQEIEVRVAAVPDRVFKARVIAIGAASDSATRRVSVRSEIPNPDSALKSEMFASFKIATGDGELSPGVPTEAVIWEGSAAAVWVQLEPMLLQRRQSALPHRRRVHVDTEPLVGHALGRERLVRVGQHLRPAALVEHLERLAFEAGFGVIQVLDLPDFAAPSTAPYSDLSAGAGRFAVEFSAAKDFVKPDLIVYWVAGSPNLTDKLPGNARLLGAFNSSLALPLSPDAGPGSGVLVLYSLADQEIVEVSRPFALQKP
jgi:hypothetical protein